MSVKKIPLSFTTPRYDVLVELDRRDYLLDLAYNPRGQFFALRVKDAAGNLLAGQKLAGNAPMLRLFDDPRLPPGRFWVIDAASAEGRDPNRDTLGTEVYLLYEEAVQSG